MDDRIAWGALAALLVLVDLVGLELVGVLLAVAALGGLLAAALGAPFVVQALVAGGTGALMLGAVRPLVRRRYAVRGVRDPADTLTGVPAVVVEQVSDDGGQVRVHGELWRARPALPGVVLAPGASVWVGAVSGATLLVHPLSPMETP